MTVARSRARGRSYRGFALFVVLWFLVLLAAIGTYLMTTGRSQMALARNVLAAAQAEALADSGVADAVFKLTEPLDTEKWALDGSTHSERTADGDLAIRLIDESQKINANLASPALLQGLLLAVGVDAGKAKSLSDAIGRWVGTVKDTGRPGSEAEQYHDAGLDYAPPHAPAASLDELRLVLGMTPQIFTELRPYLTVYTNTRAPDPETAPPVVQEALAFEKNTGQPIAQNPASVAPAGQPPQPPGQIQPASPPGAPPPAAGPPGTGGPATAQIVAEITVTAHSREGAAFVRYAVVRLDQRNPKGYVVLDWERFDVAE